MSTPGITYHADGRQCIWLLMGETDYERPDIVRAYESKDEAEAEAARLNEILRSEPSCPSANAPDAEWDVYDLANQAWERRLHPHSRCSQFEVSPLTLQLVNPTQP